MKRIIIIVLLIALMFVPIGCSIQESDYENTLAALSPPAALSPVFDELKFTSLHDFLSNYNIIRDGKADDAIAGLAESVAFASLERFYIPTGIPESYQLFRITVTEGCVELWYLPEEYLESEETILIATMNRQHFLFSFTRRLNLESPMDGVLRQSGIASDDLIDGKYYFDGGNLLIWASNGELLFLHIPVLNRFNQDTQQRAQIDAGAFGFTEEAYMIRSFAETSVVNLFNAIEVSILLEELADE